MLLVLFVCVSTISFATQEEEVRWQGSVVGLGFIVTFAPEEDGSGYKATMDIPAQGLSGAELTNVVYSETEIAFTLSIAPPNGATWRATRQVGATAAEGEFEQGGNVVPFTMELVPDGKVLGPRRPQTPEPPFAYDEREVAYTSEADGTKLAGTLTVPRGDGPFPAVLLITGSGAQNRDEEVFGHKPFLVIADHLTSNGIAVLRVDDRGIGGSTGEMLMATSEDFASDVLAGVHFLTEQSEIDPSRIGLIGHSEGGIIAPMVAAASDDVAFIVLLAGSATPGRDLMIMQLAAVQRSNGLPEGNVEQQIEAQRSLLELASEGAGLPALTVAVAELVRIQMSNTVEGQRPSIEDLKPGIEAQARLLTTPWWRFFLAYDPRTALREVQCPVLAINGSLDVQVPPGPNLDAIRDALAEAGNDDITVEELGGLNHLFQTATTGSPTEYAEIEETFAPAVLDLITSWVLQRMAEE
tara:strand:+ start:799 stop:2205 length:1407 start_codon:yes stop_codon:yes gene_type:complete